MRQEKSKPIVDALFRLLSARLPLVSAKSKLAYAIRYATLRWTGLTLLLENGRVDVGSNTIERAIRPNASIARTPCSPAPTTADVTPRFHPAGIRAGRLVLRMGAAEAEKGRKKDGDPRYS